MQLARLAKCRHARTIAAAAEVVVVAVLDLSGGARQLFSRVIAFESTARSEYNGVTIDFQRRFANNWQGMASYIYSKLEGNYDGEYAPFTNVGADPNISAAYDYYDFFTNGSDLTKITNRGALSNDRRNQFKVSGTYLSPFKLSAFLLCVSHGWPAMKSCTNRTPRSINRRAIKQRVPYS